MVYHYYMNLGTAFPARLHVRQANTKISRAHPHSRISLHIAGTLLHAKEPKDR